MHAQSRRHSSGSEPGFTVVEVIIAALLVTVVASGIMLAVAGTGKLMSSSNVNSRMARATSSVFERVESNRGWVEHCGLPSGTEATCSLFAGGSGVIDVGDAVEDSKLDTTWELTVTGVAVDDAADGLRSDAAGDRDGQVPDQIRVTVRLAVPAADAKRLGNPKPIEQTRTFDGKGRLASGSLVVEVCDVTNQIDERMSVETCAVAPASSRMADCPPGKCSYFDAVKANAPSDSSANGSLTVRRHTTPVTLQITNGSTTVTGAHLGDGSYVFKGVDAGSWNILYPASLSNGHVVWKSHLRPAAGRVAVQPNTTSRGLVIYRPNAAGSVEATFTRSVGLITWVESERVQTEFDGDWIWRMAEYGCGFPGYEPACPNWWVRYKTDYREDNKAWMEVLQPERTDQVWGGASNPATLSARPEAFGRALSFVADGSVSELVNNHAVAPRRGTNAEHVERLDGITSGLNSRLIVNSSDNVNSDPANVMGGMWVDPSNGGVNGAGVPRINVHGQGECYVAFAGVDFFEGHTSSTSGSSMDFSLPSNDLVTVEGFLGWRDDACSMSTILWNDVEYDCITVCAYRFCWEKRTQNRSILEEMIDKDDPSLGWTDEPWDLHDWYVDTDCWGYDPPLACQDWGATICGPAPEVVHIPPRPIPCNGCGTAPAVATKFQAIDAGT